MVLHVTRNRAGRRRLQEIAVLCQGDSGRVRVVTAWHADSGMTAEAVELRALLQSRVAA